MTHTITYCINGCTRFNADGEREPTHAKTGQYCAGCLKRLDRWLEEIPQRYALLPDYLLPSAELDRNPDAKAVKRTQAPVPIRLAALDLLDERRGRKWQGLTPTDDRRGTLGTLLAIANEIRASRNSDLLIESYVMREADYIRASLNHLATLGAAHDAYSELKQLHRQLGDATGQYPPRPVGTCYIIPADTAEECGGPLLPTHTGVTCPRCGTRWDQAELRRLGTILEPGA